jgi:lipoate-protein ligase A
VGELTYSVIAASNDIENFGTTILEAYQRISGALILGLQNLGVKAEIAPKAATTSTATAACFDAPGSYEITVQGRKLIGSAQARRGSVFLQQGTILLEMDVPKLFEVLNPPLGLSKAEAVTRLLPRLTSIQQVSGQSVSFEQAQAAFIVGFATHFKAHLHESPLTASEVALAQQLRAEKYANPAWNMTRQRPRPVLATRAATTLPSDH